MTAYTLAADANLRDIGNASIWGVATARTGGDTVGTNGFKLTIDQDSRYGLSGTTSTTWGSLTITSTKGGEVHIDGTKVWMIPFTGGSGTLTLGTQITIGGVTCNTIGIYTSLTVAPATTGASGWLKVTNASGTPGTISSGTYAGFTLTANGAAIRGFIEINGDDASAIVANRLGVFRVTGEWFELGTTSGASNQTMQIPNNGVSRYCPGVYIEQTSGAGDYEFYPNAGTVTTIGTEAARGKVVWIDATGLVRIGNSGAATNGYTPAAGLKVVVPNIFFECNTTAARTVNVIPNATIATRYDFNTTGGGVVEIDKACMNWYLSCTQAYSVNVSNSCFTDGILLSEVASPMTFSKVGVGNKPTTALAMSALTMSLCFAGGTFADCVWTRVFQASSGSHSVTLTDIAGFSFVRDTTRANTIRGNATTYSVSATRVVNCNWENPRIIQGQMNFAQSANVTIADTIYVDCVSGSTVTTYAMYVWNLGSSSTDFLISGLTFPITNAHPYTSLLYFSLAGCSRVKLRNIGTRLSPLSLGSANACAYIWSAQAGAAASDIKIQRVYCSNTRSGTASCDNSLVRVTEENVAGDPVDNTDILFAIEHIKKGYRTAGSLTAQQGVYGSMFADRIREPVPSIYQSSITLSMNEPTAATADQVVLTGGAAFTSSGGLYMPTPGMSATFTMPYYVLGHGSFGATAISFVGGALISDFYHQYQLDLNDGNGFSDWSDSYTSSTAISTALNASIIGVDPSKGFKLRYKLTTLAAHTNVISSISIVTATDQSWQDYQYPLDQTSFSFHVKDESLSPVVDYEYRLYLKDPASGVIGTTEIDGAELYGYSTRSILHEFSTDTDVVLQVIKEGYEELLAEFTLNTTPQDVTVYLRTERNI